jgi:predicted HicB family RNase H-like nuclease
VLNVSPKPKDKAFLIRVAEEDLARWKEAAELADMKIADWIRRQLNPAAAKQLRAAKR